MNDALHVAASSLRATTRMVEAAAQNAANAQTPGYKGRTIAYRSFKTELDHLYDRPAALVNSQAHDSMRAGMMVQADSPTSIALSGPGFLEVSGPGGKHYTRNGDLTLSGDGKLMTRAGYAVVGKGGEIRLDPAGPPPSIDPTGQVMQGDAVVGELNLVEFGHPEMLERTGETLFHAPPEADGHAANGTGVMPRMLEMPKERSVVSMVAMISANRNYESVQRTIRTIASSYEQLVRQS